MVASFATTEPEWDAMGFAEMQALDIYEASLCPSCKRPMDICAAEFNAGTAYMVDSHICMAARARAVTQRVDEWDNTDREKRSGDQPPYDAVWSDGLMYAPRIARPDELKEID